MVTKPGFSFIRLQMLHVEWLSVCLAQGWTDQDTMWEADLCGPKEPRINDESSDLPIGRATFEGRRASPL